MLLNKLQYVVGCVVYDSRVDSAEYLQIADDIVKQIDDKIHDVLGDTIEEGMSPHIYLHSRTGANHNIPVSYSKPVYSDTNANIEPTASALDPFILSLHTMYLLNK